MSKKEKDKDKKNELSTSQILGEKSTYMVTCPMYPEILRFISQF
jgi:hypothetical protein